MTNVRAAVVGGGIIGAAVARELSHTGTATEVVLYEKEPALAQHQTGHNSGVVHAGLYYEPGSLKATLCRRGVMLLREVAVRKHVPFQECGKVVVARDGSELSRLAAVYDRAVANGVPHVRLIDGQELERIEPHARGIAALHSPTTAITDYTAMTRALAEDFVDAGGEVRLSSEVISLKDHGSTIEVGTRTGTETYRLVVNCAGLQSDRVAWEAGDSKNPRVVPFFGAYFRLKADSQLLINGLIYPVPDPRYPFLGVHLTKRINGEVLVGPNAFVAGGRESYDAWHICPKDVAETAAFPGFWRFAATNIPTALREGKTVVSRKSFIEAARDYVPDLQIGDVVVGGRGIRAQAMNGDGSLVDDFVITGSARMIHVRNAPSPGATSSMAIAEHIVRGIVV